MEKFLARFKPYRKRSKDGSASTTTSKPNARPTGAGNSSTSQNGKREHTVGMPRSRSSFAAVAEVEDVPQPTTAPRIDLDFKIPGERTILDPPAPISHGEHLPELGDAKDLLASEKKAVDQRRFSPEVAAQAWKISGGDLLAIGLKNTGLFDVSYDGFESTRHEFYRLAAIFAVSTDPSCLTDYPSLSNYFPPPAFVTDDHDWSADYSSYSGYIRNPQVLVQFLKWVVKRVNCPESESRSENGLPGWYQRFSEQETTENYPPSAWHTILPSHVPTSYCRYLEELFDRVALISANEADNSASIDYMCGVLSWWLFALQLPASVAKGDREDDRLDVLESRWEAAAKAMGHLFRCWIRGQSANSSRSQLPLLIRNLVDDYRGDSFERVPAPHQTILFLQVRNDLEHDQRPPTSLSQEELGVGLIREAKYGSPVTLAGWQDLRDDESAAPGNSLFGLLSRSSTANGETLTDFDPAVVPLPLSPSSPFETRTVYRPFRKASTSSFFSDLSTPLGVSRSNSWLPSSEPAKPSSSSSSIFHSEHNMSRPITGLTASKAIHGEEADWKTFTKSGFSDETKPIGLQLGDAFEEKRPGEMVSGSREHAYQSLSRQNTIGPLSPPTPRSDSKNTRRQARDVYGVFTIDQLQARDIPPAFFSFLRDAEIDADMKLYANWPVLLVLKVDETARQTSRLAGEWIVVSGTRRNLSPPPAPQAPPAAEKRPLPASPSFNSLAAQTPSTVSGTSSKRAKTYRRTSLFGMLSMGSLAKTRSPPSGAGSPSGTEEGASSGLQPILVNELGQIQSTEASPTMNAAVSLNTLSSQRPRAASYTSRKQVPGMLDDVKVEPSSSLDPVEALESTASLHASDKPASQSPVEITASDSRGNLVDLQRSDAVPSSLGMSAQQETTANPPETPTSSLRPETAETDTDVVMSTPQRGRRSAAPSPDSALAEPVVSRSTTPEPLNTNQDQPAELPQGVNDLTLSEPPQAQSDMSPPRAEGFVQLGAALPITSAAVGRSDGPVIVASSVLEEADTAGSLRTPPSFVRALVAGAVAGLSVDLMFYPIDTIKTRLQSQQGFVKAGGFKGIYKGVGSVGVGSAPGAAAFFTAYENLKVNLPKQSATFSNNPALTHMFAASGGEFMACLIRVPTEIVKSRTQTSAYGAGASSLSSATNVWKLEGLRGFYRGFGITLAREIPFTAIQFPLYESLKTRLSEDYLPDKRKPLAHEAAVCGMIAGGIAAALTTPLDVVKTRAMLEAKATKADGASRRAASVLSIPTRLAQITSQEGVKALFAGVVPRTMWISLGGAVFLGAYDLVSDPFQLQM